MKHTAKPSSGSNKRRRRHRKKKPIKNLTDSTAVDDSTKEADIGENAELSVRATALEIIELPAPTADLQQTDGPETPFAPGSVSLHDAVTSFPIATHLSSAVEALASHSFDVLVGGTCEVDSSNAPLQNSEQIVTTSDGLGNYQKQNTVYHCFSHLISETVDLLVLPTGERTIIGGNSVFRDSSENVLDTELSVGITSVEKDKMPKITAKPTGGDATSPDGITNKNKQSTTEKGAKEKTPEDIAAAKKLKEERRMEYQQMKMKTEGQKNSSDLLKNDPASAQKSKSELKASRRLQQEAQRAAKSTQKGKSTPTVVQQTSVLKPKVEETSKAVSKAASTLGDVHLSVALQKVQFFSHLQQYKGNRLQLLPEMSFVTKMHPAIVQVGLQYAEGIVVGSNARCVAMMHALKQVITSYTTPLKKELARDLEDHINLCISYLQRCRPLSVSMENAAKFIKFHVTQMTNISDSKAKEELNNKIDSYIEENIRLADEAIANFAMTKINDAGDEILTFAHSSVIASVLIAAHNLGKNLHVTVVDSKPQMEGKKMVTTLVKNGIRCSYTLINSLSYTMQKVTKVFLGAHALLANGYVMSRVGSSQVALVAKAYNVPVLICCETYKFSERVQTDSFVYNELMNPDDLQRSNGCQKNHLQNWENIASLNLINLAYDVTPPELVSAVVTELGMLPCTSVPVVLRVKNPKGTA